MQAMMRFDRSIEQILEIGALVLLAIGCIVVLWPFLSALLWAAVLCFSTWPMYTWLERMLGGRRTLAALLMTLLVALVVVAPFAILVATLADSVASVVTAANRVLEQGPPAPPTWVAELPLIGERLAVYWQGLAYNAPAFVIELTKLIRPATDIAVASGAVLGVGLLELALSVFIAFFFYRHGRQMAAYVRGSSEQIAGTRARHLLSVAGSTVTGVVYGLIGTALAQGMLAGIGFWIAGVPQALLLGFLTFVLSFVPMAPPLVWGSVALWLFFQGEVGWGIFVAAWGLLLVSSIATC
jgi:predicted PurR-regulated permease PerM